MENTIRVGGKDYEISPLRMKHFRKISEMLKDNISPRTATFADIDKWLPFLFDSISVVNQDFRLEMLDELTIPEFNDALVAIINLSGIKVVNKGEVKPTASLTTKESTDDLPSAVNGPIQ